MPHSFADIIGEPLLELLNKKAPRKVWSRIAKAEDHFVKARSLKGVDEEMGAIRLIAAEEELVVAIFEIVKLHAHRMPEHSDFVRKYKNHYVKLAFYPVLHEFRTVMEPWFRDGLQIDGAQHLPASFTVDPATLRFEIHISPEGQEPIVFVHDPLSMRISRGDDPDAVIVEGLFAQLQQRIIASGHPNLKTFVSRRANYRNDLLYAHDGGYLQMGDSLDDIVALVVPAYRDLLWCIALLLSHEATGDDWGLVAQFIGVYRRVLQAANVL